MSWHIYSLTDPRDGRVRYVGKAKDTRKRMHNHISEAICGKARNYRLNWIRSLVEGGQLPSLSILESGEGDWAAAEKKWIKAFRDAGYELVNATDGGDGTEGYEHSQETRRKIGITSTGRRHSIESRQKISVGISKQTRRNIAEANRKRVHSAETLAKMSAAQKARWALGMSNEHRAKLSAAGKAGWIARRAARRTG